MNLKTLKDTPPWDWPDDAQTLILQTLADKRAKQSDRVLAADLAGESTAMNDDLAEVLLAIVNSTNEPDALRCNAAISLGPALETVDLEGFDDPEDLPISKAVFDRIQETFYRVFFDKNGPKQVRRRVLEASVRNPRPWHMDEVRSAYGGRDEEWRLTAVFCMRYIKGFDDQIRESLESKDPEIRYEAVRAAGNWGIDSCWAPIAKLVTTKNTEKFLLLAAIEAAASIRPNEVPEILDDLLDSKDEDISEAAFDAISLSEHAIGDYDSDVDENDELDDEEDDEENK